MFLGALLATTLAGCGGTKATLSVEDIALTVGETVEIAYTLDPLGLFAQTSLEIVSSTPADAVSIDGMMVHGLKAGSASLKATAENMAGASTKFKATDTFTVTINPIVAPEGEFILNGGFEYGLNAWTFDTGKTYQTEVVDNYPHGGEYALNLWLDEDADSTSDAMDMTMSQEAELTGGTYLFSLWYQGTANSIEMTVKDGTTDIVTEIYSGFDYKPVPDHQGYVNVGVEFTLASAKTIAANVHVLGDVGFWGYIDDVSLKVGTIADLLVAPANVETLYRNHIENGGFATNEGWTVEITGTAASKQANFTNGKLRIWTTGAATLRIYRSVEVTANTFNLCVYLNGGVFGSGEYMADISNAYVSQDETVHELDIEPSGWNDGLLTRIEKSGIVLNEGTVEVGVHINFTGGTNNWVDLDDFTMWSYNIQA